MSSSAKSQMTAWWEWALNDPDSLIIPINDSVPLIFRPIPAGEFWMGARGEWTHNSREEPRHRVRITRPFWMAAFPTTQAQWSALVERNKDCQLDSVPSHFKEDGNLRPVEQVSWDDCRQWCEWLATDMETRQILSTKKLAERIRDHHGKEVALTPGLPTEAQWEYACRGGIETEYYMGDGEAALLGAGWFDGNSGKQTQRVGQLAGNDFGLFDMHGNVWEFCLDGYDEDAYKQRVDGICDPYVPFKGDHSGRVIRGGGWDYSAWFCRSAFRFRRRPDNRFWNQGFRACLFSGPCPRQQTGARAERGVGGDARRDDEARRQLPRGASEFFGDAKFPSNRADKIPEADSENCPRVKAH